MGEKKKKKKKKNRIVVHSIIVVLHIIVIVIIIIIIIIIIIVVINNGIFLFRRGRGDPGSSQVYNNRREFRRTVVQSMYNTAFYCICFGRSGKRKGGGEGQWMGMALSPSFAVCIFLFLFFFSLFTVGPRVAVHRSIHTSTRAYLLHTTFITFSPMVHHIQHMQRIERERSEGAGR